MRTRQRKRVVAAALAAAAIAAGGVVLYVSNQDPEVSVAAPAVAPDASLATATDQLRSVLLSQDEHPAGTNMEEVSLVEARVSGMIGGTVPGVVVSPTSCIDYLSPLLGDPALTPGWVQMGFRGDRGDFSALAAKVPGGVDLAKVRSAVAECGGRGTITLELLGVTGTFTIAEVEAPKLEGAETFGVVTRMSFPEDVSAETLGMLLTCGTGAKVVDGTVQCDASPEASAELGALFTTDHFFTYAAAGDILVEACEIEKAIADQMAATLFERARPLI